MALRIAVLVSGEGTNLQAILDAAHDRDAIEVVCVGASRPDARGLKRARAAGVRTGVFAKSDHPDREARDAALGTWIDDQAGGFLQPVRTRYVPINSPVHSDLIPMVRARLRPPPGQTCPPKGAARSRRDFEEAIPHRPMPRGVTTDGPSL